MADEIFDLNTQTARGVVILYAKYNDRYIPVKVLADGTLESNVSINASDIQIGAIELKDSDTGDRANVGLDQSKKALYIQSESLNNELQLINGNLGNIGNEVSQVKDKLISEGITYKEWIWPTEEINITSIGFVVLKAIDLKLVKSKTFYFKNVGSNDIYLNLSLSVNDEDFYIVLNNQRLSSGNYAIFTESNPYMSLRIEGKVDSGTGILRLCGYGLGG